MPLTLLMKLSSILGLNARNRLFSQQYSASRAKKIARSKILTKRILAREGVATPQLYKVFRRAGDVYDFCWEDLPGSFALKPSKGFGGEGIIVVKKKTPFGWWITTQRKRVTVEDLKLHTLEILEGAYNTSSVPDSAFCEEYIGRHNAFRKLAFRTTPDIRIIVFNKIPVMAMLRLPTRASGGRANLHQGAVGVGVDIGTGVTTHAVWYGQPTIYKPGTKRKLDGIKIPSWSKILETALAAAQAVGLPYSGVDVVLHPEKGPLVLEVNTSPGLSIQLANMAPLRRRLEKVEDLHIEDAQSGIRIARALFSLPFSHRVQAEDGTKTINAIEEITILDNRGKKHKILARIDTGAARSSLDKSLAQQFALAQEGIVVGYKQVESSFGRQKRPVIAVCFWLARRKIYTTCTLADRKKLTYKMLIGRRDLSRFLVNP